MISSHDPFYKKPMWQPLYNGVYSTDQVLQSLDIRSGNDPTKSAIKQQDMMSSSSQFRPHQIGEKKQHSIRIRSKEQIKNASNTLMGQLLDQERRFYKAIDPKTGQVIQGTNSKTSMGNEEHALSKHIRVRQDKDESDKITRIETELNNSENLLRVSQDSKTFETLTNKEFNVKMDEQNYFQEQERPNKYLRRKMRDEMFDEMLKKQDLSNFQFRNRSKKLRLSEINKTVERDMKMSFNKHKSRMVN